MARRAGHPQPSTRWALLCSLAWAWALHAGCVSFDLPPDRTDSSAGGSFSDLKPAGGASGGNSGEGARDATGAPDVPTMGTGTGGSDISGSGGHIPVGTGGFSIEGDGAIGGATGPSIDGACDGDTESGEAGGGGSDGRNDGKDTDVPADALDAPPGDAPTDARVAAPTVGLILHFPCEAADGNNLQDRSGSGNNGQIVTASADGYTFEPGKIGNALRLSQAQNAYLILSAQIFRGANALTIATWVKLSSLTTWQRLFDIGVNAHLSENAATGTAYFNFILKDYNDKLGLSSSRDGYNNSKIVNADALAVGVWKHVAVVTSAGAATIYIDGSAASEPTPLLAPGASGAIDYAFVGRSQFPSDPSIDAEIDELRVYNRALSADEIRALFEYVGP